MVPLYILSYVGESEHNKFRKKHYTIFDVEYFLSPVPP